MRTCSISSSSAIHLAGTPRFCPACTRSTCPQRRACAASRAPYAGNARHPQDQLSRQPRPSATLWFQSFRSESSRVRNYCRGVQEIQGEFRGKLSETRACAGRREKPAVEWATGRNRPNPVSGHSEMVASKRPFSTYGKLRTCDFGAGPQGAQKCR
jgi:hypothetical protein